MILVQEESTDDGRFGGVGRFFRCVALFSCGPSWVIYIFFVSFRCPFVLPYAAICFRVGEALGLDFV